MASSVSLDDDEDDDEDSMITFRLADSGLVRVDRTGRPVEDSPVLFEAAADDDEDDDEVEPAKRLDRRVFLSDISLSLSSTTTTTTTK